MAYRSRGIAPAFRNNQQLQQFVLTGVTPTGRVLGTGSYGSVEEVTYKHLSCAGKKLHETLLDVENEGVPKMVHKYLQECQLMSSLHHPNITQFLGLCFLPGTRLPVLVMERLETSFDDLLEHMPNLPLSLKRSVLEDISSGLLYLHERPSPIIHRDLTARNVLLTSSLMAKITDMGNSRIITMKSGQIVRTLSQLPGTLVYMPPEAMDDRHRYGPSLDIFSFGHLALFALIQKFPGDLLHSTYYNPGNTGEIRGRSELERRGEYIESLEGAVGLHHPELIQLVKQCLHDAPHERPSTYMVLARLRKLKAEVEGEYGGGVVKLDLVRLRLAKEMKDKNRRIEELTQEQEAQAVELLEMARKVEHLTREVQDLRTDNHMRQQQIEHQRNELLVESERSHHLQDTIETLHMKMQHQQQTIETLLSQMQELRADVELGETHQREEPQEVEIMRLREELREEAKVPLEFPLQLSWKHGTDMPFGMVGCIQSVVVQGTVYVGGGYAGIITDENYIVMKYDSSSKNWTKLPPYRAWGFAMTVIRNQLVLVGGEEHGGGEGKVLGVWGAESGQWTHPYPEMALSHSWCSVAIYNEWLVVAGGCGEDSVERISCVEVMNTDNKQWYAGPPTPTPWSQMRTAIVGDTCYFMGGLTGVYTAAADVYSVSLPALISQLHSQDSRERGKQHQIWKQISGLSTTWAFPVPFSESLLAVGGRDKGGHAVATIHLYQPDTGVWVKVGDLPTPRFSCTCAMITDEEMLVAGGSDGVAGLLRSTEIALIHTHHSRQLSLITES